MKTAKINDRTVYLDKYNHWRFQDNNAFAPNPLIRRCCKCNKVVRAKKGNLCPVHIDWTKTAHGASILTDDDVELISLIYNEMTDLQITKILLTRKQHKEHQAKSLLFAIRHHRRKYLSHRYDKKYFYITVKNNYRKAHLTCEICSWNEASIDVHHILQIKDFQNELDYHKKENLICLCPNHHRVVETMRTENRPKYMKFISQFKQIQTNN